VSTLKRLLGDRDLKNKRLKEYLIRLIYVEMLGHDASFGYMKVVEVRQQRVVPGSPALLQLLRADIDW